MYHMSPRLARMATGICTTRQPKHYDTGHAARGQDGLPGSDGAQGPRRSGADGAQGIQGPRAIPEQTAPKAFKAQKAIPENKAFKAQGDTGEQGIQGPRGDAGEQGIQGPSGVDGSGYIHPTTHSADMIDPTTSRMFVTQTEKMAGTPNKQPSLAE